MTKIVNINEAQTHLRGLLASAREGDEIIIEENGQEVGKITPIAAPKEKKKRTAGLGKGTMWMSDDFDDELPDEFWGFDKEL